MVAHKNIAKRAKEKRDMGKIDTAALLEKEVVAVLARKHGEITDLQSQRVSRLPEGINEFSFTAISKNGGPVKGTFTGGAGDELLAMGHSADIPKPGVHQNF